MWTEGSGSRSERVEKSVEIRKYGMLLSVGGEDVMEGEVVGFGGLGLWVLVVVVLAGRARTILKEVLVGSRSRAQRFGIHKMREGEPASECVSCCRCGASGGSYLFTTGSKVPVAGTVHYLYCRRQRPQTPASKHGEAWEVGRGGGPHAGDSTLEWRLPVRCGQRLIPG